MNDKKVLLVYYTRTGTTRLAAEAIKNSINCDSEEIVDLKNRKGIIQFIIAGKDALKGNTTNIKPIKLLPKDYDLVIMGCPVWASHVVPALRAYINQYKNDFRSVAFFATEGGSGGEKALKDMEDLCGMPPAAKMILTKKTIDSKNYLNSIKDFVKNII
jgi:flavodoxin